MTAPPGGAPRGRWIVSSYVVHPLQERDREPPEEGAPRDRTALERLSGEPVSPGAPRELTLQLRAPAGIALQRARGEPRHEHGDSIAAGEADAVPRLGPLEGEGAVGARRAAPERGGVTPAQMQRGADHVELDGSVVGPRHEVLGGALVELREQTASHLVVDGAAVVGVDEAEVPEVGALIHVGHSGRREREEGLSQGVDPPGPEQRVDELAEGALELSVESDALHEAA